MNWAPQEEKNILTYLIELLAKQVGFVQLFSGYSDFKKRKQNSNSKLCVCGFLLGYWVSLCFFFNSAVNAENFKLFS